MRTHFLPYLCAGLLLAGSSLSNGAVLLFEDNFNIDPGTVGATGRSGLDPNFNNAWTEAGNTDHPGFDQATVVDGNSVSQEVAQMLATNTLDAAPVSMTRLIDAAGFTGLQIQVEAFNKDGQAYEGGRDSFSEFLAIYYDTGSGFTELFYDDAAWQGVNETLAGSGAQTGSDLPVSTAFLALPAGADNNSALGLRLAVKGNNGDEWFINRVSVTAVPEPSAGTLISLGALLALSLRRRRSCR